MCGTTHRSSVQPTPRQRFIEHPRHAPRYVAPAVGCRIGANRADTSMKALSIKQPWVHAIPREGKDIETEAGSAGIAHDPSTHRTMDFE